jgi:muconolactone delta-isomerase
MKFMVESTIKQAHTEETLALIPAEQARGQELDAQGVRHALYLAADFTKGWQVLEADSEAALDAIMQSFPLYAFADHRVTPLA